MLCSTSAGPGSPPRAIRLPLPGQKLRELVAGLVLEELAVVTRVQLSGEKSRLLLLLVALGPWERT